MLLVTLAVLAFVGATLMVNLTVNDRRAFSATVEQVLETEEFGALCRDFSGDLAPVERYLASRESVLGQTE